MPTRHSIEVHVPIPPQISPAHVVATLQTFEPLLDNHGYVVAYRPKSGPINTKDLAIIRTDPFFKDEHHDLFLPFDVYTSPYISDNCAYPEINPRWWLCDVWEDVYWVPFIVPYWSRLKRYLAVGVKTEGGIRFRQSVSGGVVTRGTFTVVSRETGRAYVPRERTREQGGENWDGDTEKGSIAPTNAEERGESQEHGREDESERRAADNRKGSSNWDAQTETDAESEPMWDIVCACEIEMPLILIMSQILRRDANRELCEHLCKSIISATVAAYDEYRIYGPNLASS
ncbi:hypothetical protein F5Y07DRAFT_256260 [Xylaria sp. FL0933]|nr:hypothetical protein F5Y07DRAFT_256260 [Xylaria sp. FL0933]